MSSIRLLLVLISVLTVSAVTAQDSSQPRILLIPFNPDYYLSDADLDIARHSNKDQAEVRREFQAGLNLHLHARIVSYTSFDSHSLLRVEEEVSEEDDLYQIYEGVGYRPAKPKSPTLKTDPAEAAEKGLAEKLKGMFTKDGSEKNEHTGLMEESGNGTYMEATVRHPEMLHYLAQKYDTDFFLFVNQFELITHYEHCLDRTISNFNRTVKVHVSLYDASGELLYGNAISVTSDSGSQTVDAIVAENVQPLIEHLVAQLPKVVPETASF